MYLVKTKSLAVKAMRTTLDADYSDPDFRNIPVEMEYPVKQTDFPSVWVHYDPVGPLRPVGVGYFEDLPVAGGYLRTTRWNFAGIINYTLIALSSLELDRLFDQVVSIISFGTYDVQRREFRTTMEHDPLIQLNVNFDEIDQGGFAASPGTPWGTDDMMYEATVSIQVIGEFVSSPGTELLIPISKVNLITWITGQQTDPTSNTGWIQ